MNNFLDGLYGNIGRKIKNLAKWAFFVEAILVVAAAIVASTVMLINMLDYFYEDYLIGLILLPVAVVVSLLISFASSWILYAFGDFVENISIMKKVMVGEKIDVKPSKEELEKAKQAIDRKKKFDTLLAQGLITQAEYEQMMGGN